MKRTALMVGMFALLGLLAACSKESVITPATPPVNDLFTKLERFSGRPPADLLNDEQIGKLIRSLVPQTDFKCLDEAMEWMPDLELASDGSLRVRQTGSHADQFRETYLSITPEGSFDLVLLCQIDAPGTPKGKYHHFTNSANLKSPSKPVQEWLYNVGRSGDMVAVSDGKQVMDVPFETFVAELSAGAAAPVERYAAAASPTHSSTDAKAGPAPETPQTGGGGMLGSIMGALAKPFSNESNTSSTGVQAAEPAPPQSPKAEPPVQHQATQADSELRRRCIKQAVSQNYRSGQCAFSFIDTCIRTQSRSEMEAMLRIDAMLGTGDARSCPNMPSTFVADFDKFVADLDKF